MAQIVTFAGLGGRNRDIRVKHLVTQPGSAPKARPSHLTTVDVAFEGLSKGLAFEDRKGRVLQRMQTLNWDTTHVWAIAAHTKASWVNDPQVALTTLKLRAHTP